VIHKKWKYKSLLLLITIFILSPCFAFAQENEQETEVYLSFSYRSAINSVVIAYFKNNTFYLPYKELFQLLDIENNVNLQGGNIQLYGRYLEEQTYYELNLAQFSAEIGDKKIALPQQDFIIKELDYYLKPEIFSELFGLDFTVDFNNLSLDLKTEKKIPVVQKILRQQKRERIQQNARFYNLNYPVVYNRDRKIFGGGFIDYNLSAINSSSNNVYIYNTAIGFEAVGGDVQGSLNGNYSSGTSSLDANNLRWRYAFQNSDLITNIQVGQTFSTGLLTNPFTGVKITNEPFEPRRLYDEFTITGNTIPQSEVELYINNSLVDFKKSDELGNYRFITPLTYGNSQYDLRVFGPTGQVREISQRVRVPFTFLPPGEINYNINIGELDNSLLGTEDRGSILQGDIITGINDWLTAEAGVEYFENFHDNLPTFTGGLSARFWNKYLVTTEIANEAFFRSTASVIYANSASLNFDYTEFITDGGIYNPASQIREFQGNAFYPFAIRELPLNLRVFGSRIIRETIPFNRYRVDLSSRINRLNLRLGVTNARAGENILQFSDNTRFTFSATYNFSQFQSVPKLLRNAFLRGELSLLPRQNKIEEIELLASKNIFEKGNIQFIAARNFRFDFNSLSVNLVIDFNKTRVNSTFRNIRKSSSITNNIRGSVGFDPNNNNLIFSSRNQVGRSASAVRLFVDYDGNEVYSEGDQLIENNAVRIDRTGSTEFSKNGVHYITQMQPYFKYNMEINKGAIENPLLVPKEQQFGVISDPNFFKPIDIPFYSSGIIEGRVVRKGPDGGLEGIGGLRIFLIDKDAAEAEELRTFSDGGFYSYEVPPGNYTLQVDSTQLNLLNVSSEPRQMNIEIESLANGDFVEGLRFVLTPTDAKPREELITGDETGIPADTASVEIIDVQDTPNESITAVDTTGVAADSLEAIVQNETSGDELNVGDQGLPADSSRNITVSSELLPGETPSDTTMIFSIEDSLARADSLNDDLAAIIDSARIANDQAQNSQQNAVAENQIKVQVSGPPSIVNPDAAVTGAPDTTQSQQDTPVTLTLTAPDTVDTTNNPDIPNATNVTVTIPAMNNKPGETLNVVLENRDAFNTDTLSLLIPPGNSSQSDTLIMVMPLNQMPSSDTLSVSIPSRISGQRGPVAMLLKPRPAAENDSIGLEELPEFETTFNRDTLMVEVYPETVTQQVILPKLTEEPAAEIQTPDASVADPCTYTLQFVSYFENYQAQNYTENIILSAPDAENFIIYNAFTDLFAIRGGIFNNLHEPSEELNYHRDDFKDASVVNLCYSRDERKVQPFYAIELNRYKTKTQAQQFADQLYGKYAGEAYIIFNPKTAFYSVRTGASLNRELLESEIAGIASRLPGSTPRVVKEENVHFLNVSFRYRVQAGIFNTLQEAESYALTFEENFNLPTVITNYRDNLYLVMVEKTFTRWNEVLAFKAYVENTDGFIEPVIHMMEYQVE